MGYLALFALKCEICPVSIGKIPEDIGIYVFVVLFYGEMWCLPRRKCDIAAKDIGLLPRKG